jgi:glycosyltransferase involved in cell wall biosynthesis
VQEPAPPRKPVLFFRQGGFSHINDRVAAWLREQFPETHLVEIDILQEVIKPSRFLVCGGAAAAMAAYLPRILRGRGDFRDLFFRTPFLFHAIRRRLAEKYSGLAETALFSIQTQSLYDASIEGLPHFLYTDHTHLANLRYPGAERFRLASPRWIKLETALYHRVRANLVMSAFIRDSLIEDYGCNPSRIAVIGAAPNLPLPAPPVAESPGCSNRTILFVGVDWERKGGPILLAAFRTVLKEIPGAHLVIAGCRPAVEAPNVEVLGRVPLPEISRLLDHASLLALPSWREPQGVIAIEALMHGVPVVASSVAALPEMVEHGKSGLIVPPGDSTALAAALIRLLSDAALCRRYGEAGRESIAKRYSGASVSRRLGQAIRGALASASHR